MSKIPILPAIATAVILVAACATTRPEAATAGDDASERAADRPDPPVHDTLALEARDGPKREEEVFFAWDVAGVRIPHDYGQSQTNRIFMPPPQDDLPPPPAVMLELEAALYTEISRLRRKPASYAKALTTFRTLYADDNVVRIPDQMSFRTREGTQAVDEAIAVLNTTEAIPPLLRSPRLDRAARKQAHDLVQVRQLTPLGIDGTTVHERLVRYGPVKGMFAENIAAGYTRAPLLVLQLLVDDGIQTRSDRFHLLAPTFKLIGIGCVLHPVYRVVCVMDFAEGLYEVEPTSE